MVAAAESVLAIAMPVRIARAESSSANIRNDCATLTLAIPLSVTVTPPETKLNTEDTIGAGGTGSGAPGLTSAGVTVTVPVRSGPAGFDWTFTAERGAME